MTDTRIDTNADLDSDIEILSDTGDPPAVAADSPLAVPEVTAALIINTTADREILPIRPYLYSTVQA